MTARKLASQDAGREQRPSAKWHCGVNAPKFGSDNAETKSGHFYRYLRGLEVYVWVTGFDGKDRCGRVRIRRADIEAYLREAKRRAAKAKARRG